MPHAVARFFNWPSRRADRRFAARALLLVAAIVAAGEGVSWVGRFWRLCVDVQKTPCMPARVTLVKMGHPGPLARGDLVAYRTDQAGPYFSTDQIMGKRVAAMSGDRVTVSNLKLSINGKYARDLGLCRHKHLPQYCADRETVVPADHVFLLADHPDSFDSRYWGPIPEGQVIGRIVWPQLPEGAHAS